MGGMTFGLAGADGKVTSQISAKAMGAAKQLASETPATRTRRGGRSWSILKRTKSHDPAKIFKKALGGGKSRVSSDLKMAFEAKSQNMESLNDEAKNSLLALAKTVVSLPNDSNLHSLRLSAQTFIEANVANTEERVVGDSGAISTEVGDEAADSPRGRDSGPLDKESSIKGEIAQNSTREPGVCHSGSAGSASAAASSSAASSGSPDDFLPGVEYGTELSSPESVETAAVPSSTPTTSPISNKDLIKKAKNIKRSIKEFGLKGKHAKNLKEIHMQLQAAREGIPKRFEGDLKKQRATIKKLEDFLLPFRASAESMVLPGEVFATFERHGAFLGELLGEGASEKLSSMRTVLGETEEQMRKIQKNPKKRVSGDQEKQVKSKEEDYKSRLESYSSFTEAEYTSLKDALVEIGYEEASIPTFGQMKERIESKLNKVKEYEEKVENGEMSEAEFSSLIENDPELRSVTELAQMKVAIETWINNQKAEFDNQEGDIKETQEQFNERIAPYTEASKLIDRLTSPLSEHIAVVSKKARLSDMKQGRREIDDDANKLIRQEAARFAERSEGPLRDEIIDRLKVLCREKGVSSSEGKMGEIKTSGRTWTTENFLEAVSTLYEELRA